MKNKNKPFFYEEKKTPFLKTALIFIISAAFIIYALFQVPDVRKLIAEPLWAAGSYALDLAKSLFSMTRMYKEKPKERSVWVPLELPDKEILFAESLENLSAASEIDPLADLRETPIPEEYSRVAAWEYQDPELNYEVTYGSRDDFSETEIRLIPPVFEHADLFNDGAAILSALLRFWGETENQYHIASQIHPDPLDPDISFADIEGYVTGNYPDYDVILRRNGDKDTLIKLLRMEIPVLIRVEASFPYSFWLHDDRVTAVYMMIHGYESGTDSFIYQDTAGSNTERIASEELLSRWYPFQRSYMVVYPSGKDPEVRESLAEDFYDELNRQKADSKFRMDSQMLPGNPYAQYNFGAVLFRDGDYGGAWDYFKKAAELSLPRRFIVYQNEILETALNLGYADDLEELIRPVLSRNSHDEILQVYNGWAALTRGDPQKAADCFDTAGKINPGSEMVLYALKYKETSMQH